MLGRGDIWILMFCGKSRSDIFPSKLTMDANMSLPLTEHGWVGTHVLRWTTDLILVHHKTSPGNQHIPCMVLSLADFRIDMWVMKSWTYNYPVISGISKSFYHCIYITTQTSQFWWINMAHVQNAFLPNVLTLANTKVNSLQTCQPCRPNKRRIQL